MLFAMPPLSNPRGGFLPVSANQLNQVAQPSERKPGAFESVKIHQQQVSLPPETPASYTKHSPLKGKLVLNSKLRYGRISFEPADLEFFRDSPADFQQNSEDDCRIVLEKWEHADGREGNNRIKPLRFL